MPKFRITGPNGEVFVVNAPEGATEAQALAQVRAKAAKPAQPSKPAPRSGWQTAGDFIGDTVDNVLPNWGDEIYAAGRATRALVDGKPMGQAFKKGQRDYKRQQDQYDKEHPALAWGSTLTGLGASLALPAGNLARGASMGAKVAQGAKVGAAYGAVSGAGEGETLADRGRNAVRSGAIGAAMGGTMTPLIKGTASVGRKVRNNVPGVDATVRQLARIPRAVMRNPTPQTSHRARQEADRMLHGRMNDGHIQAGMGQQGVPASPDAIAAEVERRQAVGVPAIVGDTTEAMRNLTSWSSRGMGPGQSLVRQRLDSRKAAEAARVREHIIAEMGDVADPLLQAEQHAARARAQAAPRYQEAYAQPMVVTPEIEGIMATPAFQEALPQAVRNIRNARRNPEALGMRMMPDGTIDPQLAQTLSTEGFDQVIRAMRDSGRAAMDTSGFKPVNTTNSVHINARAGDLRDQLADQNPAYKDVTERYADDMAQRDAFVEGQEVANRTGHEINAQSRSMPQNAQGSWTIGARTALADEASQYGAKYPTGDTAAHVRQALGDDVKQQAIGEMMGNTGAVRGLQDRLEAEAQGNQLWKEVQANSRTAHRQALDESLDEAAGSRLSSLTPRGMATAVVNHLASRATSQFRNDVKDRIAQVVTETNPATVRDLMAQIAQRAEKDADFAQLLQKSGVLATKAYANNIVPLREESPDEF